MRLIKYLAAFAALLTFSVYPVAAEPLETALASYHTLPLEYRLDGLVEAVNRTTVSAQTQGQVQEMLYDVDDFVEKNAVLARLKDTEHRSRVSQAAADLKSATARLRQAKDEHERVAGLYRKKNVSDSAMDKATTDLASAQADLEAATARLDQAREQLAYTEIRAPYSGIVTHRHVELGEIASPGSPIMSGISLDELRVTVDVPQSIIPAIRRPRSDDEQKALARVYLSGGGVIETSNITVFPYADLGSNTFKVRIDLPTLPEDRLRALFPGMFVKTSFIVGEKSELTVPRKAVVHRSEVTGVYVVSADGGVHFRQVRLGRVLPETYVVLAGLSADERVALDPIAAGVLLKEQAQARIDAVGESGHD